MKKRILAFIVLLFMISFSVVKGENKICTRNKEGVIINIDVPVTKENFNIKLSSLVTKPKTIILETNKECLLARVDKCNVSGGKIFVLDTNHAKTLFVFDLDGKYITRIGRAGKGPGEYLSIGDFTIDENKQEIYILANGSILLLYKFDGTFLKSIPIKISAKSAMFIQYFQGNIFAYTLSYQPGNDDKMLLKLDPATGRVMEEYLSSVEYNSGWNGLSSFGQSFFFPVAGGVPKFAAAFMHTFFSLDNISPAISIQSKYLSTKNDLSGVKDMSDFSRINYQKLYNMYNYVECNRFIYFNTIVKKVPVSIIYDRDTNSPKVFGFLKNDLVYKEAKYLPYFVCSDNKGVYDLVRPSDLEFFLEDIENDNLVKGLDKIDQLRELDEESNPVIFYYEYRNEK